MSTTVYTFNDKVLVNSANDKWLKKAPEGPIFDEVTIGTQTWMAKNLAIDDGQGGITIVNDVTANGVNMGTQYFYNRDAAVRVAASVQGWHLPTKAECETLKSYCNNDAAKLKSTTGWDLRNGTDDYGFTAWPVGNMYDSSRQQINGTGNYAQFQTNSYDSSDFPIIMAMSSYGTSISIYNYWPDANTGYSVRLIKDVT